MSELHPAIVHLPIGLLIAVGVFSIISLFTRREKLKDIILWIFSLGILSSLFALISGLNAEHSLVHNSAIHEIMEVHETNAFVTIGIFTVLFAWFVARKKKFVNMEYGAWVLAIFVGCGFLSYQGYTGGEMVYQEGAGVEPMESMIKNDNNHADKNTDNKFEESEEEHAH